MPALPPFINGVSSVLGLLVYLPLLLFGLLTPFDFDFNENHAAWLPHENGIAFRQKGQILSAADAPGLFAALTQGEGLTLEVWLKTDTLLQKGPARILSYSQDPLERNFTLGQSRDRLVVRLRTENSDRNGVFPHLEVPQSFNPEQRDHLVYTYDYETACVYRNGHLQTCDTALTGTFSNWDPTHRLVIGNEATGDRPWSGELYYAAIYDRPLSPEEILAAYAGGLPQPASGKHPDGPLAEPAVRYAFGEGEGSRITDTATRAIGPTLDIPPKLPLTGALLNLRHLHYLEENPYTTDNFINILIFVPLGFLLQRRFPKRPARGVFTIALVVIIGLAISLGCEILQHFSPSRTSSVVDVITNGLGVWLGALAGRWTAAPRLEKKRL